jgi:hypothetical protein
MPKNVREGRALMMRGYFLGWGDKRRDLEEV